MSHWHEQLDDSDLLGVPEGVETCQNETCERDFWPSQSTANEFARFCSQVCQDEDAEAEL